MLPVVQKCKTRTPLGFHNKTCHLKNRDMNSNYNQSIHKCIFFGKVLKCKYIKNQLYHTI